MENSRSFSTEVKKYLLATADPRRVVGMIALAKKSVWVGLCSFAVSSQSNMLAYIPFESANFPRF